MQSLRYALASRVPVHFAAGCGARQRSGPTGGAAKGIPFQLSTPSAVLPWSLPVSTVTSWACALRGNASAAAVARIKCLGFIATLQTKSESRGPGRGVPGPAP